MQILLRADSGAAGRALRLMTFLEIDNLDLHLHYFRPRVNQILLNLLTATKLWRNNHPLRTEEHLRM